MTKKISLAVLLGLAMTSAAVFADHPDGWGIGAVWGGWRNWDVDHYTTQLHHDLGFSFKIPALPVFWGVFANIDNNYENHLGGALTADCYLIDAPLIQNIHLNWYAGLGLRSTADHFAYSDLAWVTMSIGGRGVLGLSWQPPINKGRNVFEIFVDVAPSLGLETTMGDKSGTHFPAGGWGGDAGIRLWL